MTLAANILTESQPLEHTPVMLKEVLHSLAPVEGGVYVDATVGWAGHARAILGAAEGTRLIAFDRDPQAVRTATSRLSEYGERVEIVHASFSKLEAWLEEHGIDRVDGLLADLGVSSPQLDDPERGMSFRAAGPLDMRMDPTEGETALELIERLPQSDLADLIYQLGEERRSRRVARCVKQAFERGELHTTVDLRRAVVRAVGPHRIGGADPATRTFQALRIAVNRELEEIEALLEAARRIVRPGGIAAFISFHSLEDRLVKRAFSERDVWLPITKKPLTATVEERESNPRARSAKLRAARRQPAPERPRVPGGE